MTAAASIRAIEIARIDTSGRLRGVNDGAVAAYVEERQRGGTPPAIKVVERPDGYRLINGLQRLEAAKAFGAMIEADVRPAAEFPTDVEVRRAEIIDNFMRHELTKLDRAIHLAEWKATYAEENDVAGHGGRRHGAGRKIKSQKLRAEQTDDGAAAFVARFSLAAAQFLGISERAVQLSVQIATGIAQDIRLRIALTDIAHSQSELLELARQTPERQAAIVDLLLSEPPSARSVAEAIALLDGLPVVKLQGWERLSGAFARLKPAEQQAFYAAHEDDIRAWLATRDAMAARRRKAA
jgi:ParB family chromosome partitioning protein